MADVVEVRMISNLLRAARMNSILLPDAGETVELDKDSAERLVKAKHARYLSDETDSKVDLTVAPVAVTADPVTPKAEPEPKPEPAPEPAPAPADGEPAKRGPGRPRKSE